MRTINRRTLAVAVAAATLAGMPGAPAQDSVDKKPPEPVEPDFGPHPDDITFPLTDEQLPAGYTIPEVSPTLPTAVVTAPINASGTLELFQLQQAFDLFAWKTFIALNWPSDPKNYGAPDPSMKIGQAGEAGRVWETFIPPRLVFKDGGAAPDPYKPAAPRQNQIHSIGKREHLLNEVDEAFFNLEKPLPPILDTNNEYARYEIRLNETEYDYVVTGASVKGAKYPLYSVAGQKKFIDAGGTIVFPNGSIEVKVAWKKLGKGDDPAKFFTQTLDVYENPFADPPVTNQNVTYGMVAMHIMSLVDGSPQWVWPSFEHVDNAPLADLRQTPHVISGEWYDPANPNKWERLPVKPSYSFYNLGNQQEGTLSVGGFSPASRAAMDAANKANGGADYYQAPNTKPARKASQIAKVITSNNAIVASKWTYALNAAMQDRLRAIDQNSVWANYRLVSTQWPSDPGLTAKWQEYYAKQKPPQRLGAGTIRAGNPAPVSLGNAVAETYMQINGSCMNCHSGATLNFEYASGPFKGSKSKPDADFSFMLQRAK